VTKGRSAFHCEPFIQSRKYRTAVARNVPVRLISRRRENFQLIYGKNPEFLSFPPSLSSLIEYRMRSTHVVMPEEPRIRRRSHALITITDLRSRSGLAIERCTRDDIANTRAFPFLAREIKKGRNGRPRARARQNRSGSVDQSITIFREYKCLREQATDAEVDLALPFNLVASPLLISFSRPVPSSLSSFLPLSSAITDWCNFFFHSSADLNG